MKRVLSVLSVLCLLIAFLPAGALRLTVAAETYGDLTYSVSDGKVTITDCATSATGSLTIPATIADYPVTTIATSAFADCTGLTAITIGDNVTSIETGAFSGCTGLSSITVEDGNPVYHSAGNCLIETSSKTVIAGCNSSEIPTDGSVTAIGSLAFYKCGTLPALTIPDNIVSVGASAFEGCTQLATVTIGNGVTSIGNSAFLGCTALTSVIIPDSVTTMGVYAFSGCTSLTDLTIGVNLTAISNNAFSGCTELTDVTIGAGVITIDIFAFSGCASLTDITIPSGVTTIGKFAFYNCGELTSVEIPESVSSIGSNAFSGCTQVSLSVSIVNTYATSYAQNNDIPYTTIESLAVTTVTLRPSAAGVYFGGSLDWAENNQKVLSYGFAVSTVNPLPVADDSDESSLYTQGSISVLVENIMKTENTNAENASNARMKIYARAYVQLADGEYIYSDAVQVSLRQVVIAAQNQWDKLTAVQQEALQTMYDTYSGIMSSWNVPNLKNA